jgi:hypothetical protein
VENDAKRNRDPDGFFLLAPIKRVARPANEAELLL